MVTLSGESILLHVCCAPCAAGCMERLLVAYKQVALYYSNSNIATDGEFERRLACVEDLACRFSVPLYVDPYDHGAWLARAGQLADAPEGGERCRLCFEWSLGRAAEKSAREGFGAFATTLTVSPRKRSGLLLQTGADFPAFAPWDFKKRDGYRRGVELAREWGYYRQDFCGCEFSLR